MLSSALDMPLLSLISSSLFCLAEQLIAEVPSLCFSSSVFSLLLDLVSLRIINSALITALQTALFNTHT